MKNLSLVRFLRATSHTFLDRRALRRHSVSCGTGGPSHLSVSPAARDAPIVAALLCTAASLIANCSTSIAAGTVNAQLVVGEGVPVCEAYLNEVSASGQLPAGAECLKGSSRQMVGISAIDLGPMFSDDTETLARYWDESLEKQVIDYLWVRDANPAYYLGVGTYAQWRGTRAQLAEAKRVFGAHVRRRYAFQRRLASVDVDNDGKTEPVLFLPVNACSTYAAMPIVLTSDLKAIDQSKTALIAPHPSRASGVWREGEAKIPPGENRPSPYVDAFQAARYTFFVHGGKTYLGLTWTMEVSDALRGAAARENSMRRDRVFLTVGGRTREACAVEYQK